MSRLVGRARANQTLAEERAAAKVKENLATGSEGTAYHVKENSARRSARQGLPATLEDAEAGKGPNDADDHSSRIKRIRDEQDRQEVANSLLPAGSWRCSACNKENFPSCIDCTGWSRDKKYRCSGSQSTTWGGYAILPESKPRLRVEHKQSEHYRASFIRLQAVAKEKDGGGYPTDRARVAQSKISERRVNRSSRLDKPWEDKKAADPDTWDCDRCFEKFGVVTTNRSSVYFCYRGSTSGFPGKGATTEEQMVGVSTEETGVPARRKKKRGGKKHKKSETKADDKAGQMWRRRTGVKPVPCRLAPLGRFYTQAQPRGLVLDEGSNDR